MSGGYAEIGDWVFPSPDAVDLDLQADAHSEVLVVVVSPFGADSDCG